MSISCLFYDFTNVGSRMKCLNSLATTTQAIVAFKGSKIACLEYNKDVTIATWYSPHNDADIEEVTLETIFWFPFLE